MHARVNLSPGHGQRRAGVLRGEGSAIADGRSAEDAVLDIV
jgi:hypothetical protein